MVTFGCPGPNARRDPGLITTRFFKGIGLGPQGSLTRIGSHCGVYRVLPTWPCVERFVKAPGRLPRGAIQEGAERSGRSPRDVQGAAWEPKPGQHGFRSVALSLLSRRQSLLPTSYAAGAARRKPSASEVCFPTTPSNLRD